MTAEDKRQSICLVMIVRDEAHIIADLLDATAPYIDYWVVVDTGSTDGTQDFVRRHMAALGIPGELHERLWRDFGYNRSEAIALAQGKSDYIWMMDADDTVIGVPQFGELTADCYAMLIVEDPGNYFWRRQLFRDGVPWYYRGVLHEYACCDEPFVEDGIGGEFQIHSRRLGARGKDPRKWEKDAAVLLAYVSEHPEDERSVFFLAQSYYHARDFENARAWYARRADLGGWDEEVFYSLLQLGRCLAELRAPDAQVDDAYARAWAYEPTRAEPLYELAYRMRVAGRYELGYLFARQAAALPAPVGNRMFVDSIVYNWCAIDEQAVCASWVGRKKETFELCRRLLAVADIDEDNRARFAANRDVGVPELLDETAVYPADLVRRTQGSPEAAVTFSLIAGPDRASSERALNSFLRCCADVDKVGRFLLLDIGMQNSDRAALIALYPFVELVAGEPGMTAAEQTARIAEEIGGPYWLHAGQGWQFFATDPLVTRLCSVLHAEPDVSQVGINYGDATALTGIAASAATTRTAVGTGRYVPTDTVSQGPKMVDVARFRESSGHTGFHGATLDEVLCIHVSGGGGTLGG